MTAQRRYIVRLQEGDRVAGVLENARTGAETPFRNARQLLSLLSDRRPLSSEAALPARSPSVNKPRGEPRRSRRTIDPEEKK